MEGGAREAVSWERKGPTGGVLVGGQPSKSAHMTRIQSHSRQAVQPCRIRHKCGAVNSAAHASMGSALHVSRFLGACQPSQHETCKQRLPQQPAWSHTMQCDNAVRLTCRGS